MKKYKIHKRWTGNIFNIFTKNMKMQKTYKNSATTVPSTPGQLELGKVIMDDFKKLGINDVEQDTNPCIDVSICPV